MCHHITRTNICRFSSAVNWNDYYFQRWIGFVANCYQLILASLVVTHWHLREDIPKIPRKFVVWKELEHLLWIEGASGRRGVERGKCSHVLHSGARLVHETAARGHWMSSRVLLNVGMVFVGFWFCHCPWMTSRGWVTVSWHGLLLTSMNYDDLGNHRNIMWAHLLWVWI